MFRGNPFEDDVGTCVEGWQPDVIFPLSSSPSLSHPLSLSHTHTHILSLALSHAVAVKATDEGNTEENWQLIMNFSDKVAALRAHAPHFAAAPGPLAGTFHVGKSRAGLDVPQMSGCSDKECTDAVKVRLGSASSSGPNPTGANRMRDAHRSWRVACGTRTHAW
jgi:hypothetical protein